MVGKIFLSFLLFSITFAQERSQIPFNILNQLNQGSGQERQSQSQAESGDRSKIPSNILSQLDQRASQEQAENPQAAMSIRGSATFNRSEDFPRSSVNGYMSPAFRPRRPFKPCNCWFDIWNCFVPVMFDRIDDINQFYDDLSGFNCYSKKQILYEYVNQIVSDCSNPFFAQISRSWFNSHINNLC